MAFPKCTQWLTGCLPVICVLLFIQTSSFRVHLKYMYPPQSLACKMHDNIRMDCSKRNLVDLPPILNHNNITTTLDLSYNNLTEINGAPFVKLSNLRDLYLNDNQIYILSDISFIGLHMLELLELSNNILAFLPTNIFSDLSQLLYLYMTETAGALQINIPSQALRPLHLLQKLYITGNFMSLQIGKAFQNLKHLNTIQLYSECLSSNITNHTFDQFSGLPIEEIYIAWEWTYGNFTAESGAFSKLTHAKQIIMDYDALPIISSIHLPLEKLYFLPSYSTINVLDNTTLQVLEIWNSTLHELTLDLYDLESIEDYSFIWVSQLTMLDLSDNNIANLATNAFYGLQKLNKLRLCNNQLASIPSAALGTFTTSTTLMWLDLSFNLISSEIAPDAFSAVPYLTHLDLGGNKVDLSHNWVNTFHNLTQIILDESQRDPITGEFVEIRPPLQSLKLLQYSRVKSLTFMLPMCRMLPYLQYAILSNAPIYNFPSSLALGKCFHLVKLDLSGSVTNIKSLSMNQPVNILSHLRILGMARNKMTSIKQILFIKAPMLETLDLSYNDIKTINNEILMSFRNLVNLDLEGNTLTSLDGLEHLKLLKSLILSRNQITTVPTWLLSRRGDSTLERLDLSQNPFLCTCDIQPFKTWIISDTITWLLPNQYICASPDAVEGMSVTSVELDCRSHIGFYLGIGIPFLLVLCISIILLYHYRWHIKYRLFLFYRNLQPFPEDDFEMFQMDGHPQYHAYVAYDGDCEHDEGWVFNELRPNMEEGPEPLRLCIKARDFIPGQSIIQTISESILQSRKTILVITPHFVESEWCYYEMQMAQMRLFHENRDVLILVLLEDIPDNKLTMSLRQLLCKKEYLKWPKNKVGQILFWQKLREALKTPVRVDRRYNV